MDSKNPLAQTFPNFSSELINSIQSVASYKYFEQGTVLMKSGQYIRSTILVLKGKVKVYREDYDGNEFLLYYLTPGQACAISMICASKQETSEILAKVVEDAEVLLIPLQEMGTWASEHKSWYAFIIETYQQRFDEVLQVIDQIAFRSMDERLVFYLQRNAKTNSTNIINASHQEIATDLSTSREVISRLLKKMEQRGLVKLHRNAIELIN
jgi:CRP/FNR family transcriptional regulator, anaerobic regulatory protein